MNNKMAKIKIYQQLNLKKQLSKQEQRQNHGYRKHFDDCQIGRGYGGMSEDRRRLRNTNRQLQNSHGDVKYSIGKGAAKELIHMTHGHEQIGPKGGYWDNCNNIINQI